MASARENKLNQLVETLGAYNAEQDLWSEEYIPGLTIRQYFKQAEWSSATDERAPSFRSPLGASVPSGTTDSDPR